jgi:signal transduction histidine kinase
VTMASLSVQGTAMVRLTGGVAVAVVAAGITMPAPGVWTALLIMIASLALGVGSHAVRQVMIAIGFGVLGTCVLALLDAQDWREGARELLFCSTWVGVPWLAGLAWRLRGQVRRQAAERVVQEQRERRAVQRRRQDTERLTLAESLHDDLGHALSLVALNLGRLELADHLEPDARKTVAMARQQLSGAVERLGASVSVLREGAASRLPLSEGDDAAVLVETARASGADVEVTGSAALDQLDLYDRATVSRVVKESLTNAAKHAPGQPVSITLDNEDGRLWFTMDNPMPSRTVEPVGGAGSGLTALSDRLQAVGGMLKITADDDRFRLEAVIPAPADSAGAAEDTDEVEQEGDPLAAARRKGRLVLAVVVVVAVAMLGVVEAFTRFEIRRSLLPEADFAHIQIGATYKEAGQYLPDHELLPRPQSLAGTDCHDYAVTSDWLADASGDVHRICFTDGVVTSTDRLDGKTGR